jgi:hypothetical protein
MSHLTSYHFTGDPGQLIAGYDRMRTGFPDPTLGLHVCVVRTDGITVIDSCPDRETSVAFSASPDFASALSRAGLPTPQVEHLGDVHAAVVAGVAQ